MAEPEFDKRDITGDVNNSMPGAWGKLVSVYVSFNACLLGVEGPFDDDSETVQFNQANVTQYSQQL